MMKLIALALCIISAVLNAAQPAPLMLAHTISLPGVKGRFDHFAMDEEGGRLFVAALGNNTLEILDVANAKRLHSLGDQHKPTGVVYLPHGKLIGVANADDGTLRVYKGQDYGLIATVKSLDDADNVRFDAKASLVYVGYGDGALAVIDPTGWKTLGSIKLRAHPESFQLEAQGNNIFVNLPEFRQVAVVDRVKRTVVANWPMEKVQSNFPMALDDANHRLFVGCRRPARLVVFDSAAGKAIAELAISGDTDDLFYDSKARSVYASCGEGFIDVLAQRDADTYERIHRIPTRPGARTSFFSAERRELYLAVPERGSDSAEIRIYRATN